MDGVGGFDSLAWAWESRLECRGHRSSQEAFALGSSDTDRRCLLDDLRNLIDWVAIERLLASVSYSAKGEPAWPPPALFSATLLAMWYDLPDVKLAEAFGGSVARR
jgi:transposase, IS5 family